MSRSWAWLRGLWAYPDSLPSRQWTMLALALTLPLLVAVVLVPIRVSWYGAPFGAIMAALVVLLAIGGNRLTGILAGLSAAVCYDFFLARPFDKLHLTDRTDVVATFLLLVLGVVVAGRVGAMRAAVAGRAREAGELAAANRALGQLAERFQMMVEASPEALLTLGQAGDVENINGQAEELFGCPRAEIIGRPAEALLPDAAAPVRAAFEDRSPSGPRSRSAPGIVQGVRSDGRCVPVAVSLACIDLDGRPRVLVSVRDMTEVRRTERSLIRLGIAVQHAEAAVMTRNADGLVTSWNDGAERMLGYSAAEMVGRSVSILLPPDRASDLNDFQRIVEQQQTLHQETVRRRKDGTDVDVSSSISAAPSEVGAPEVLTVMQDITERKRAEAALAERTRELESVNRELSEFAYVASHDLRAPVRRIGSFCQLLADSYHGRLGEEADQYIGFIVDGARRMEEMIDGILAFSRAGRQAMETSEVDCGLIMKQVAADLAGVIEESGARVTVSGAMPLVRANPVLLTQVLENLVGNAVKFHGPEPPQVAVSAARDGARWRFAVADNGIGIERKYADRVFTMFQRLHTEEEYPGTGIGLAVCKKVVESWGGSIWFESVPGAGTTFYCTVPAEVAP